MRRLSPHPSHCNRRRAASARRWCSTPRSRRRTAPTTSLRCTSATTTSCTCAVRCATLRCAAPRCSASAAASTKRLRHGAAGRQRCEDDVDSGWCEGNLKGVCWDPQERWEGALCNRVDA